MVRVSWDSLGQVLEKILYFGNILLQVFVPLELTLHRHDVFGIPDLSVVHLFKVLLELVQLDTQVFPFALDFVQSFVAFCFVVHVQFSLCFFYLGSFSR